VSFAAAAGLWALLLALPILGLYILKIRRPRQVVPYLRLWADLIGDLRANRLFQRLQRLLSLLLQLVILLSLTGALAMLTFSDSFLQEDSVVLVVDHSASMGGRERAGAPGTRLQAALQRARDLVEGRSTEDEYAVLAAGMQPEVLQGFTRSTLRLREALDGIAATNQSGNLRAAHRLAGDLLQGKKHPRIVLLCDQAGGEAPAIAAQDPRVDWVRIGAGVDNLAIVRFQARRNHAVGTDYVLAVVKNFGREPRQARLLIHANESLLKVRPLDLPPGGDFRETHELTLPEGGFLRAELEHEAGDDGLALDDVAFAAVPTARLYRILMVPNAEHEEVPFRAAFSAQASLVDATRSRVVTRAEWAQLAPAAAESYDLVLFVNWAPEQLPERGSFLCLNGLPGGLPAQARPAEKMKRLQEADRDHPLTRFLEIKDLTLALTRPVDLSGGQPFLATPGGPIGVVFQGKGRRVVYVGIDMLADLFFLQVAFPILLRNTLAWLHEADTELLEPTYRPGEILRPRMSVADDSVEVGWRPAGAEKPSSKKVPVRGGRFLFGDTQEPGRYWVRTVQADYRTAVNLFDPSESDLSMPAGDGKTVAIERAGFLFGRDLWPVLLLLAALLWIAEWGLFHRRITQ
jgi:NAD(P)-dependent dehydrogenase (short-subunit alcohol dehydrogenase family)